MPQPEALVREDLLQRRLRVVEGAVDRQGEDIGRAGARHLALLQRRHAPVGIQNENRGARATDEAVDRRGPGVAGGGAEDIDRLPAHLALVGVEIAQQLQREVLERERRPVPELEHVEPLGERPKRRDRGICETRVALGDQAPQFLRRDIRGEYPHELEAERRVVEAGHAAEFPGKIRHPLRQVEPAVRRKPGGDGVGKAERGRLAAGGDELHRQWRRAGDG